MSTRGGTSDTADPKRNRSKTRATPTCNINVVVGFKPSLCAQKIMVRYQEYYIFGPVNLPWKPKARSVRAWGIGQTLPDQSPRALPRKWAASANNNPTAWLLVDSGPQGTVSTRDSVLAARGARKMPYTLVPDTICTKC